MLHTSLRPHGQSECNSGPHYCHYPHLLARRLYIGRKKEYSSVWRTRSGPFEATCVTTTSRSRIVAVFEVHHHKDGETHWVTLPYIIL